MHTSKKTTIRRTSIIYIYMWSKKENKQFQSFYSYIYIYNFSYTHICVWLNNFLSITLSQFEFKYSEKYQIIITISIVNCNNWNLFVSRVTCNQLIAFNIFHIVVYIIFTSFYFIKESRGLKVKRESDKLNPFSQFHTLFTNECSRYSRIKRLPVAIIHPVNLNSTWNSFKNENWWQ